jgi:hypothetical protein
MQMIFFKRALMFAFFLSICASTEAQKKKNIAAFNLSWNSLPDTWDQGAFTGNGKVGTVVWKDYSGGIRFDIGNNEVYSGSSRVPMGKLVLKGKEELISNNLSLLLEEGIVKGDLKSSEGTISFETFTERDTDLQRIRYQLKGSEEANFSFLHLPAVDSGKLWGALRKELKGIKSPDFSHPLVNKKLQDLDKVQALLPAKEGEEGGVHFRQVFINKNTGYVLVWKQIKTVKRAGEFNYGSYYFYKKNAKDFLGESLKEFKKNIKVDWETSVEKHKKWWMAYYDKGLISIPDKAIAQNYWLQYYKVGAGLKEGGMPMDLLGPWFRATPWPRIWANLNVQITYPFFNQIGKYKEANTLFSYIDENNQHFINAVPEKFRDNGASMGRGFDVYTGTKFSSEYGNFLWLLYNYSQFLEYHPDVKRAVQNYYPLLKRGVNFVIENLKKDEKGIYHFPEDVSPEYFTQDKNKNKHVNFKDTNYNIGLLQWALQEVLYWSKEAKDVSSEVEEYKSVLRNLVTSQIYEEEGLMVAKNVRMLLRHRHFSHLISFYPLGLLDPFDNDDKILIEASLEQWLNRPKFGWGYKGYTYTAATGMYARMGQGDKALESMQKYIADFSTKNGFYLETGPVIETPMHSASNTLELLVQSYNRNEIKVFTGLPTTWKEASFYKVTTEGGHLVSGVLEKGKVKSIEVEVGSSNMIRIIMPNSVMKKYNSKKGASLVWTKQGGCLVLEGSVVRGDIITMVSFPK